MTYINISQYILNYIYNIEFQINDYKYPFFLIIIIHYLLNFIIIQQNVFFT